MKFNRSEDAGRFGDDQPAGPGAFASVPAVFWEHLSPEQFLAQQQVYRTAYEKACQQQAGDPAGGEISFDI
jgi:hypothetical protein